MNYEQACVDEFHERFGRQRPDAPDFANFQGHHRIQLMQEELDEFKEAWRERNAEEMIDALCDLIYVANGSAVSMGIDLAPFFQDVHEANMRKLGPDGKPVVREDGKVIKPEGWVGPRTGEILTHMLGQEYRGRENLRAPPVYELELDWRAQRLEMLNASLEECQKLVAKYRAIADASQKEAYSADLTLVRIRKEQDRALDKLRETLLNASRGGLELRTLLDGKDAEIRRLREVIALTEKANADAVQKNGLLVSEVEAAHAILDKKVPEWRSNGS